MNGGSSISKYDFGVGALMGSMNEHWWPTASWGEFIARFIVTVIMFSAVFVSLDHYRKWRATIKEAS